MVWISRHALIMPRYPVDEVMDPYLVCHREVNGNLCYNRINPAEVVRKSLKLNSKIILCFFVDFAVLWFYV